MLNAATNLLPKSWNAAINTSVSSELISSEREASATEEEKNGSWGVSEARRNELVELTRRKRVEWVEGSSTSQLGGNHLMPIKNRRENLDMPNSSFDMKGFHEILVFLKQFSQLPQYEDDDTFVDENLQKDKECRYTVYQEILHQRQIDSQQEDSDLNAHVVRKRTASCVIAEERQAFYHAYEIFVDYLKQSEAAELIHLFQSFIKKMSCLDFEAALQKRNPKTQPGGILHQFIAQILRNEDIISGSEKSFFQVVEFDCQWEVLETFLMEKIHPIHILNANSCSDEKLRKRIASLSFVTFKHLDIGGVACEEKFAEKWEHVQRNIYNLDKFLSPWQKMNCILEACRDITSILKEANMDGHFPSADEFLPALIYVLLKCNPPFLHRNIDYISQYRRPCKLLSEPGYFFTHLVSAVTFLENLDDKFLTISPSEFAAGLKETTEILVKQSKYDSPEVVENIFVNSSEDLEHSMEEKVILNPPPSVMDVRNNRLKSIDSTLGGVGNNFQPIARCKQLNLQLNKNQDLGKFYSYSSDEIRVMDIPELLSRYKELYDMYQNTSG